MKYPRGQDQTKPRNVVIAVVVSEGSNSRAISDALGMKYTSLKKGEKGG